MKNTVISLTVATMLSLGCAARPPGDSQEIEPEDVVIVEPVEETAGGTSVAVAVSPEQFGEVASWFGTANSVTFSNPIHVERDGTTLDAKAGTKIEYEIGDGSGRFVFEKPWPTVRTNLLSRMIGGVSLYEVLLKADGNGVAKTGVGAFKLKWLDDGDMEAAAAEVDLPEVWCYSSPGCQPCENAKRELASADGLPFQIVWKDDAPVWLKSRPAFWWHISGITPSQADVKNTRQQTGWNGLKKFVDSWRSSRVAENQAQSRTVGSFSAGRWLINGSSTPSRSVLLTHLTNDGIHRGKHDRQWLATLTTEQLRWLHDRDHEIK